VQIVAHVDPLVLERELLSRVDAVHPRHGVARTLVLVPTNRLAEHVQRKLTDVRPAWLGLDVLPFRGLGREVLEQATGATLHVASPLLLEALLRRLLRERPRNRWARFVDRRPGAARHLLTTLQELREAGIEPADLAACTDDPRESDLAGLYALYHAALAERASTGWTDDAGLARAARPHAADFAKHSTAVFVHGAYELLGVYLDLLRELDRTTDVTVLVPVAGGTRATAYGEHFTRSFLTCGDDDLESPAERGKADRSARLTALYDEDGAPTPAGPGAFGFRHAQGSAAEVKFAVREALRAVRNGCPPTEIAIVAPWTSSLSSPLRRHPVVRELLLLLRVLAEGFPRDGVVELLQSRHIRWKALGCEPPSAARADAWSREAGVLDGLDEWTTELEAWAAAPRHGPDASDEQRERAEEHARRRVEHARRIGEGLVALDDAVPRAEATWSGHSAALLATFESVFSPGDDPAADRLRDVLEAMGELEHLVGDRRAVGFEPARSWLEEAVDATELTLERDDGGGIRVLDVMQLRGLTFRRLYLLGMNAGLFPRAPREDPVLPDGVRRELRERTGRPIGVKSEGTEEEHQLLAVLLGSASDRVDVSWQRADESGRARNASLALREVARLVYGRPEIDLVRGDAIHVPSHPTQWLECLVEHTGLLAPEEERLLAALHSRAADAADTLGRRFSELRPGLEMLRATQSFTPVTGAYDGRVGPFERAKTLSVSELETLGRCPLQFFFGGILGIRPLEECATAFELARKRVGSAVHELLEQVYRALRDEGLFAGAPVEQLVERGLALLHERREALFGDIGRRVARRLPLLWAFESGAWFGAVRRFVEDDLRRIGEAGLQPAHFERLLTVPLDFGNGVIEPLRGRFDRLLEGGNGPVVGDYKTSARLGLRVNPTEMLKARTLQVPLYRLMAGKDAVVELLGVHPDLDPADETHRHPFAGFDTDRLTRSFEHTMRVLLRLRKDGVYPLHKDDMLCGWCDFTGACRRNHPPTLDRESQQGDAAGYRTVLTKSVRDPDGR
jgi:ATP-dependent helicase/nuclease subunit B